MTIKFKTYKDVLNLITEPEEPLDDLNLRLVEAVVCDSTSWSQFLQQKGARAHQQVLSAAIQRFILARSESSRSSESIVMYQMIQGLKKLAHLIPEDINDLIESDDDWLFQTGYKLLNQSESQPDTSTLNRTLSIMREKGVDHIPYAVGESLARFITAEPDYCYVLTDMFAHETKSFKLALLHSFGLCPQLPVEAAAFVLSQCRITEGDLKSKALFAASACTTLRAEAITLLNKELSSPVWYLRATAAYSLGRLEIREHAIIKRIAALLNDTEGHDWSARDAAIDALADIGHAAAFTIPDLLGLLDTELNSTYRLENTLVAVCDALTKLDSGSTEVIDALVEVFTRCSTVAVSAALMALGHFGNRSTAVLEHLKPYVYDNKYMEGCYITEDDTDVIILKNLLKIEGPNGDMFKKFLDTLKNDHHPETRRMAASFEKNLLHNNLRE
ncbi:HEAT repeat domain-containing protein [Marinicella sediminis]|uniref:HEAT repeat domain-containing protein n=1 Tax=Marinicella sediminis TaxID=1792834 RepID=A0ABV7JD60_9GAMM|nr:HEAT repeat domain-containing protein [Marinicella sediminis]